MKRLIGSDGAVFVGEWGTPAVSADTLTAGMYYRIDQIDGTSSAFPVGIQVGYMLRALGTETLATDDIASPFEGAAMCDITSWSMDFSSAEVDVTSICSEQKEYRASKYSDITGNMEGIMTEGITDQTDAMLNQFVTIAEQASGGYTISTKGDAEMLAQLFTDDTTLTGEWTGYYFLPVVFTGFSASAGGDEAQSFSSPFRAGSSEVGVVYYKVENA